jgi:hypothetical protein
LREWETYDCKKCESDGDREWVRRGKKVREIRLGTEYPYYYPIKNFDITGMHTRHESLMNQISKISTSSENMKKTSLFYQQLLQGACEWEECIK